MLYNHDTGWASRWFESNDRIDAISHDGEDPGGKSYGLYQFSYATGSLALMVSKSMYTTELSSVELASEDFDTVWLSLCTNSPETFRNDQETQGLMFWYDNARYAATQAGFIDSPELNEGIFSCAIQHGEHGFERIINAVPSEARTDGVAALKALYAARSDYVDNLTTLSPSEKRSIVSKRYPTELQMILNYYHSQTGEAI